MTARIVLADIAPFALGPLKVSPSGCSVRRDDRKEALQPRVMTVLVALAQANGEVVSRNELVSSCWDGRVVSDDAIHRAISQLRRLATGLGAGVFEVETITRVGFRLIRLTEPTAPWRRTFPAPLCLFLAAVILGVVAARVWFAATPTAGHHALVVDQLTAGDTDRPAITVRDGLSGDLARALAGNPARVTVVQAGNRGGQTRTDLRLSGTVATLGPSLQAHVQLSAVRTGAILWADNFEADPAHADALRQTMADKIDSVINCALSTRNTPGPTIGDETSRLYLEACDLIEQYRLEEALPRLRRVTASAPNFARAWADLATTEAFVTDDLDPAARPAAYAAAIGHARRALQIDPKTGLAYYALSRAMPDVANWQARFDVVTRGLHVDPDSAELNNEMGNLLLEVGRVHEALPYFRRAKDLDPLNPSKTASAIPAIGFGGSPEEAEALIDRALVLWPNSAMIWRFAVAFDARSGDMTRAQALLSRPDPRFNIDPGTLQRWRLWLAFRQARTSAAADRYAADVMNSHAKNPQTDALPTALELAAVGKIDRAYSMVLNRVPPAQADDNNSLFRDYLEPFRADPRFMTLAAQRGLLDIWRRTDRWPDFCLGPARAYDCRAMQSPNHQ